MMEISKEVEKFKEICMEVIPEIEKLQEIAEKYDIKEDIRIHINGNEYFSFDGKGLDGWELCNYGGEVTIRREYREVLKLEGEENADNQ